MYIERGKKASFKLSLAAFKALPWTELQREERANADSAPDKPSLSTLNSNYRALRHVEISLSMLKVRAQGRFGHTVLCMHVPLLQPIPRPWSYNVHPFVTYACNIVSLGTYNS